MKTCTVIILVLNFILIATSNEDTPVEKDADTIPALDNEYVNFTEVIEKAIEHVEINAAAAEKITRDGVLPTEETENYYEEMVETFKDFIEILRTPEYAYKFLKAKGVDRIITPNMEVKYSKLRGLVLVTLKTLFKVAPSTTHATIPITTIDKLLNIFENDDNLAMKAHALDVLYIWLPENPRLQVRVMKLKGLEPFYNQVSKLDTSVISTLLDLFNKILKEHLKVRNDKNQRSKMDSDKFILYQRIGLIERMSTPTVCNGLLNIFGATWSYSNDDNDVLAPVFELIKNIKPYCTKVFKRKANAIKLFEAFLEYAQDDTRKEYFDSLKLNVTDINLVLKDLVDELKRPTVKDEF